MAELIVYACPLGALAESLDRYFERAVHECGPNTAHEYMPHVTLTGFFHDGPASVYGYIEALDRVMRDVPVPAEGAAKVTGMLLRDDFHLLTIESMWFRSLMIAFRDAVTPSTSRADDVRPKEWLHLSLAYGFSPADHARLSALAEECIQPDAACMWEVRLYERAPGNRWSVLASWPCRRT